MSDQRMSDQQYAPPNHYALLGLHPSASVRDIRQAYRDLSKQYHPDTTLLPPAIATAKFQQLNEAYATLSNPDRRTTYDQKIGYSRVPVIQVPPNYNRPATSLRYTSTSAYLDPTDRPLSPGEIFALFLMGLTIWGCLILAIAIGFARGDAAFEPLQAEQPSEGLQQSSAAIAEPPLWSSAGPAPSLDP